MSESHSLFSDIWILREIFGHIEYKYIKDIRLVDKLFYQEKGWIDPKKSFRLAIWNGDISFAQILWQKTQFYKYSDKTELFMYCCEKGILWAIEDLLEYVDPSMYNNNAIQRASVLGYLDVVERLLQDSRVDPSANDNLAVQWASHAGHLPVVERLLRDPRVDPSACDNWAIRWASKNGYLDVVERLLQDSRCCKSKTYNQNS
jgi:hypothetical protein